MEESNAVNRWSCSGPQLRSSHLLYKEVITELRKWQDGSRSCFYFWETCFLNFFDKFGYLSSQIWNRFDRSLNAACVLNFAWNFLHKISCAFIIKTIYIIHRQVFVCQSHFDSEIWETTAFLNLCREQCNSTCQFLPSKISKLLNSSQW